MDRVLITSLILIAGCSSSVYSADEYQETEPQTEVTQQPTDMDERLPLDPDIRTGRLDNGLFYMIRHNERPDNRAELRLVVDAGSILEDEDQRGLAHFVEHMAFNGTKHFEKQSLVDYLESVGMRFGPDINAYTSFDETVYMLQLPTDSVEVLETGFQILRDWAGDITFEPEEIDKERGVIIEEWRLGRGGDARIRDQQLPVILHESKYAERLPIGTVEILEQFEHALLTRFYDEWYRPNLMTVIAVGDFDPDEIEKLIRDRFADLQNPETTRPRLLFEVPDHAEPLYSIESDPEATSSAVVVMFKHSPIDQGTRKTYRDQLVLALYSSMLNIRFDELTQSADPPYVAAGTQDGGLVRTRAAYNLIAIVRDGTYERALKTLLQEAERVRRFGFTTTELDRAKTNTLRGMEIAFNERDKTASSRLASEYLRHVLSGESVPGITYEFDLTTELLPTISLADVNSLVETLMTSENQVITVSGADRESEPLPTVSEIQAVFEAIASTELVAYEDQVLDMPLLPDPPEPGRIVEERRDSTIDVTYLTLSNGVKVVLRPTDFKNDEVLLRATSPGGLSLSTDPDYMSAAFATQIIGGSGVGSFGPIELEKKLTGKAVRLQPVISSLSEGFVGSASPRDLETLFQLVYLYGTEARADNVVFASYLSRISSVLSSMQASPQSAFNDTLSVTVSQHHYRTRPLSEDVLSEVSLDESFEFFKDRFADFGDFTFYFVGAFEMDLIRPLIEQYLGSLPTTGRVETWRDDGRRTPPGVVEKTVIKGVEPQSRVAFVFSGDTEWSIEERRKLLLLQRVLNTRLREILREDLGGTYGVSVNANLSDEPLESYRLSISFGCAPERVDELVAQVFEEIDRIKSNPTEDTYLERAREASVRAHELGLRENSYWLSSLQFYLEHDLEPTRIPVSPSASLDAITGEDLMLAARFYLNVDRYVRVTLMPESTQ